jgi:WD40 repeat protein
VRLWNVTSGQPDGEALRGHTTAVWDVVFSPDGRELASASADGTVRQWDLATREPAGEPLTGPTGEIYDVAYSPDGRLLGAASGDRSIWLWDLASAAVRRPVLTGHTDEVLAVTFSPDGRHIASASADRTARLWDNAFDSWLTAGCSLLNRNMSMSEWDQVLPEVPYERTCPNQPPGLDAPVDAQAAEY